MTTLQTDILEIYNSLVTFSDSTVKAQFPKPITVKYDKESRVLTLSQGGKVVNLRRPVYYCLALDELLEPTYLLPEDYDYLMQSLQNIIMSGKLLEERTCLSPENYGFDVFATEIKELWKGPDIIGSVRFVSGTSWFFKFKTKRKYKL